MEQFRKRTILRGLLFTLLLVSACENAHPEIDITMETDFRAIIESINRSNQSLAEKLAAIDAAVGSQSTELSTKLALIETAVKEGFAEAAAGHALIQTAVDSLQGSQAERFAAIEKAIQSQTAGLETKLDLIQTALPDNSDLDKRIDLVTMAVQTLGGDLSTKIAAIDSAVKGDGTQLDTKMTLILTALQNGFTDEKTTIGLIQTAIGTLGAGDPDLLATIQAAQASLTAIASSFTTGGAIADVLQQIITKIAGIKDYSETLAAIEQTLEALKKPKLQLTYIGDPDRTATNFSKLNVEFLVEPASTVIDGSAFKLNCQLLKQFFPQPRNGSSVTTCPEFSLTSLTKDPSVEGKYIAEITCSVFGRLVLTDCTNTRDTSDVEYAFSWYNTTYYHHSRQINTSDLKIVDGKKTCSVPVGPELKQMGLWDNRKQGVRADEIGNIIFPGGIYREDADIQHGGGTREYPYLSSSGRFISGTRNLEVTLLEPYETGDRYCLMVNYELWVHPSETFPDFKQIQLQMQLFLTLPIDDSKHHDP